MPATTRPIQETLQRGLKPDSWNLALDKFSFERNAGGQTKTTSLTKVLGWFNHAYPHLAIACRHKLDWLDRLAAQYDSRMLSLGLVNHSRLLLHLGRANVLENVGLYCDHTTGLPLIPGTAIKGVLSTRACWTEHFNSDDGSFRNLTKSSTQRRNFTAGETRLARQILGDNSSNGSDAAGEVVFVGGFPTTPPELGLDIVNPHHEPGGDPKQRLTPSTFLCVEPGTVWRFVFHTVAGVPDPEKLLHPTNSWLEEALSQTGLGAKTAAGYGRFRIPNQPDRDRETERRKKAAAAAAQLEKDRAAAAATAATRTAAQNAIESDYPNDRTFRNRVLSRLKPDQLANLESEIPFLEKPENGPWLRKLKRFLAAKEHKDIRKRLRAKEWFPQKWLPG